ncbi:hypothetical protein [Methylobacterium marchantiae]|uniref:Uncharacterized protein n=1 Tax=Methylobacterium marchantiae TaxID=600331 RepID=A0ABW3X5L9_9HYPH|nr:hypothetical protein AIGOOFII_0298 [Methylobacterium marchantiae]
MIPLMFAAIGGGAATASIVMPFGPVASAIAAPFGGSLCALLAAFHIARRRGPEWQSTADLDEQADAMVAALRGIAAQAERDQAEEAGQGGKARAA